MNMPTIEQHIEQWVGTTLPDDGSVVIYRHSELDHVTSDGSVVPLVAISSGHGTAIGIGASVAPLVESVVNDLIALGSASFLERLAQDERFIAGVPKGYKVEYGSFRWIAPSPAQRPMPNRPSDITTCSPRSWRSPAWLRAFPLDAIVLTDQVGIVVSAVGLRPASSLATELSVETERRARGQGLARVVVTAAVDKVIADNRIALYLYLSDNKASGALADKCGFPNEGWTFLRLVERTSRRQFVQLRVIRLRGIFFGIGLKVFAKLQNVFRTAETKA
jgi:hypothetical protein